MLNCPEKDGVKQDAFKCSIMKKNLVWNLQCSSLSGYSEENQSCYNEAYYQENP